MHSYCDEIILAVWKTTSTVLGKEGPAKLCKKGEQKRNVLVCPPVGKKVRYDDESKGIFVYQKPVALYAELLVRYTPHPCTVAEITGTFPCSHVDMGSVFSLLLIDIIT